MPENGRHSVYDFNARRARRLRFTYQNTPPAAEFYELPAVRHEALSGEWCPRLAGGHRRFRFERVVAERPGTASRIVSTAVARIGGIARRRYRGIEGRPLQARRGLVGELFS